VSAKVRELFSRCELTLTINFLIFIRSSSSSFYLRGTLVGLLDQLAMYMNDSLEDYESNRAPYRRCMHLAITSRGSDVNITARLKKVFDSRVDLEGLGVVDMKALV